MCWDFEPLISNVDHHMSVEFLRPIVKLYSVERTEDYDVSSPVRCGRIVQWDNMERVWHHIFYRELKAAPEDRAVILAVSPTTPVSEKFKCCQVFFEVLNTPAVVVLPQSVLSLYGSGYTTGITVDIGYDSTDINPTYEGGSISYASMVTGLAGRQLANYINKSFQDRNIDIGTNPMETIDDVMKNIYTTKDAAISRKNYKKTFKLPDGTVIDISDEAFMGGELFFQPDLVEGKKSEFSSLHETVYTATLKCDAILRSEMYSAVVLAGGLSMMPGLGERLQQDLEALVKKPVNIVSSDESYVVAWLGAATFAGIEAGRTLWVTKKQFEEHGLRIVKNKFL